MPLITAALGVGSSIFSGIMGANASKNAANAQVAGANASANLQYGNQQQALAGNNQAYSNSLNMSLPWLQVGQSGLANLANLMGILPQGGGTSTVGASQSTGIGSPRFLPDVYTSHGTAYKYAGQQGGRDVYQPYSSNPALVNDRSKWMTAGAGGANDFTGGVSADWKPGTSSTNSGMPNVGQANLKSLVNPSLGASGSLLTPFGEKFSAPTGLTEQNDPGFQARLKMGSDALERSAAARGGLLSGTTATDLSKFGQDFASNEYGNVYNRSFNEYATRYNQYNQAQTDKFNRLSAMSGMGQTTAQQLGTLGLNTANTNSDVLLRSGSQIGNALQDAGAARATGYYGQANSYNNMLSSLLGTLYQGAA